MSLINSDVRFALEEDKDLEDNDVPGPREVPFNEQSGSQFSIFSSDPFQLNPSTASKSIWLSKDIVPRDSKQGSSYTLIHQ